jgi:hypothetical protein
MDVQIQRRELNAGALRVSSVKDFCVDIKYEEHADTTGFPLIVCVDQVRMCHFDTVSYSNYRTLCT